MKFEIKSRWSGGILFAIETDSWRLAVEAAVMSGADLSGANLSGANLSRANLSSADLYGADLSGANLSRANLSSADLYGADLSGANLSGANLSSADLSGADLSSADLYGADLSGANLSGANLSSANLSRANLSSADLYGANLYGANLSRADLSRANLSGANLYGAKGASPYLNTPLLMLLDQPGKIRAYKLVTADGYGPFNGGVHYEVGASVEVADASTDVQEQCAAGINVATLVWCMKEWKAGFRILVVEFEAADIAAIPTATDGKFRLHRCTVVAEKDCAALGLGVAPAPEAKAAEATA